MLAPAVAVLEIVGGLLVVLVAATDLPSSPDTAYWAVGLFMLARLLDIPIINAGDGTHEHPTQALLDCYTLTQRLGSLEGCNIWIVGDLVHSRVARSCIQAFTRLGATVTVAGPPTLLPDEFAALGASVRHSLDDTRCGCSSNGWKTRSGPRCASTRPISRSTRGGWDRGNC